MKMSTPRNVGGKLSSSEHKFSGQLGWNPGMSRIGDKTELFWWFFLASEIVVITYASYFPRFDGGFWFFMRR
jgi:hypothetical protein